MGKNYTQLDLDERIELNCLRESGHSFRKIGKLMNRCHTTIGREFKRNALPRAGDLGDADGQYNCGNFYVGGIGTASNLHQAHYYFKQAAAQRHIGALNWIGFAYRDGRGVKANLQQAQMAFSAL